MSSETEDREALAWKSTEELAATLLIGVRWDALDPSQRVLARRLESEGLIKSQGDGGSPLVTAASGGEQRPATRCFTFEYLLREADHYTFAVHGGECEESVRLPALGLLTGFLLNIFKHR